MCISQDTQSRLKNNVHMLSLQRSKSDLDTRDMPLPIDNIIGTGIYRGYTDFDKPVSFLEKFLSHEILEVFDI